MIKYEEINNIDRVREKENRTNRLPKIKIEKVSIEHRQINNILRLINK